MPNLFFYITIASTLTAFLYKKKWENTKNQYFVYFLFFTFLIDKICYLNRLFHVISIDGMNNNNPFYNFYSVVTFLFFLIYYKFQFKKQYFKNTMNWFLGLFVIVAVYELFYLKTSLLNGFFMPTTIFGSLLFIITLLLFLYEIIVNKHIIFNVEKSLIFWISIGCLLFYIGVIPIVISYKRLNVDGLFDIVLNILNSIAHLCFIIGFIFSDKKYNY